MDKQPPNLPDFSAGSQRCRSGSESSAVESVEIVCSDDGLRSAFLGDPAKCVLHLRCEWGDSRGLSARIELVRPRHANVDVCHVN